jgi:hypothetical protein
MNRRLVSKDGIDHAPRRFDRVFPHEEHRVTTDGIAEQALDSMRIVLLQSWSRSSAEARASNSGCVTGRWFMDRPAEIDRDLLLMSRATFRPVFFHSLADRLLRGG